MRDVSFPNGRNVPALGQGTWLMGEDSSDAAQETEALLAGIDAGLTLIDTAEMYGDGATETFLGKVLAGRRDAIFLVSKAYPKNASRARLAAACEASLRRLATDHLDLYLLHWPGSVPLAETVEAMEALVASGKIGAWGVSNFDVANLDALFKAGGTGCATNQVLYNIMRRGPEFDLVPWMTQNAMPMMAYSPIEQGRLPSNNALRAVAASHGVTLIKSLSLGPFGTARSPFPKRAPWIMSARTGRRATSTSVSTSARNSMPFSRRQPARVRWRCCNWRESDAVPKPVRRRSHDYGRCEDPGVPCAFGRKYQRPPRALYAP